MDAISPPDPLAELEQLIPQPVRLTLAGEQIEMTPLRIGQIPAFARALQPLRTSLPDTHSDIDIALLMIDNGEALLAAAAIAVARPRAWIDSLLPDEFIALAEQIIVVNSDFFTRRVLPQVQRTTQRVANLARAGQTSPST